MDGSETTISGNFNFDLPKNRSNVIKVIGIGGGGSNAINYMFQQGIVGVDFVICNTDAQALEKSSVPIKIQLGASLTEGLGAGANPEIGRQAAQESYDDITQLLSTQTKMVFITAGMGGGTGTGAAPFIAKMAKEMDILTVGIVTMPFQFEGKIRLEQAQKGLEQLKSNVDALIVINNNKLREVYGNLGFKAGFAKADEVLATAARGIAEVITHHYTQNIDLKDAKTVLSNSGSAIMGSAIAQGANRAQESIVKALDSPLLNDNKIEGCKNVLLLIVSGEEEITIDEIGEINDFIQTEAGNNTNIIMGVGEDLALGNSIAVTIIATGFNSEQQHEIVNTEAKKIIHTLEDEQSLIHDLTQEAHQPIFQSPKAKENVDPIVRYTLDDVDDDCPQADSIQAAAATENSDASEAETLPNPTEQEAIVPGQAPLPKAVEDLEVTYTHLVPDEDNPLIETTAAIAAIEVEATPLEVVANEKEEHLPAEPPLDEEYVFNAIPPNLDTLPVIDPEQIHAEAEQQIQFDFDRPLSTLETHEVTSQEEKEENVYAEAPVVFPLETDETASLSSATEVETQEQEEEPIQLKTVSAPEEKKDSILEDNSDNVNPFDQSIQESINLQNEKRKEQLKQFNYTFKNNISRIEEMERQPAYKRMGFELEAPPEEDSPSSLSLDNDSNDDMQLRSNNSFLHDNVD